MSLNSANVFAFIRLPLSHHRAYTGKTRYEICAHLIAATVFDFFEHVGATKRRRPESAHLDGTLHTSAGTSARKEQGRTSSFRAHSERLPYYRQWCTAENHS